MARDEQDDLFADIPAPKPLSTMRRRIIKSAVEIEADNPTSILFQHTVFCQAGLPYRDPGDDVRVWERQNGQAHLKILAGEAMHPELHRFVPIGLPFGPKPRLILAYLNAEAIRTGSPVIEVESSLTAFVKRLRLASKGHNVKSVKDQLARLAASSIRLGLVHDGVAVTVNSQIVTAFDLWFPKDRRQRVLWPSTVQLSLDYFDSLTRHAVPLDERAIAALSHSALALDAYAWLAQRLHRIISGKPTFIAWAALKEQFGTGYSRMVEFRRVFKRTLESVLSQYPAARVELDSRGMTLRHSPPPVKGRMAIVSAR